MPIAGAISRIAMPVPQEESAIEAMLREQQHRFITGAMLTLAGSFSGRMRKRLAINTRHVPLGEDGAAPVPKRGSSATADRIPR